MKIIAAFVLLAFTMIVNSQMGLGFGNGFSGGNNFGGRQSNVSQGIGGLGNNFGNNGGNGVGNNPIGGIGNSSGGSSTNNANNTNGTNNVYRPLAVGVSARRKDNNGYDYGIINSGPSPMFSGRTFQPPLRRIVSGTNSVASIRQYLRLNSREGQFETNAQSSGQGAGSTGQGSTNGASISSPPAKAN